MLPLIIAIRLPWSITVSTKPPPQPPEPSEPSGAEPPVHRAFLEALRGAWRRQARPEQLAPPGDWTVWVFNGGRGSGKTRSGSEWVQERVASGARYLHLVAPTVADVRDVMIQGPAGILSIAAPHVSPIYQPSLRKLTWPNGAVALLFSGDDPESLRGPQCDTLWVDELCAMRQAQEVWDNAMFGLRAGKDTRCLVTTTPRPLKVYKALLAREGQDVVVTRSSSYANRQNLSPSFFSQILSRYAGTRLGRQEIEAELLTDVPGALWHLERIEELRVRVAPQPFERVVVAIDPATTFGPDSDETGIIVVGKAADGAAYVLDDLSGRYPPEEWARKAIQAYRTHSADRIVAEINNGGAMVESTLRSVDPTIPYTPVHASRGKLTRAEPVSALYEQEPGRVHHVGVFGPLEDQLTSYDGSRTGTSPDRLDALCWAVHELMLGEPPGRFIREEMLLTAEAGDVGALSPVDIPTECERVFAFASIVDAAPDSLGTVFFAVRARAPQLIVLDWNVVVFEPATGDAYLDETETRLKEFARLTGSRSPLAPLVIEPGSFRDGLLEHGRRGHYTVEELDDEELLGKALPVRVADVGKYLHKRAIKATHEAFEKTLVFQGVHRNHLRAEIAAFRLRDPDPKVGPLLAAFVTGALNALSEKPHMRGWRMFARGFCGVELGRARDPLANLSAASPPASALAATTVCGRAHSQAPHLTCKLPTGHRGMHDGHSGVMWS
jgi:predicted phage terminase large subunit-like protein